MVAILAKLDAVEGFKQIIDFLSGSYIHYALIVNPHIYVSSIKQFWNTALVKRSDDVTRLQALVDRKKIVISEDVIHEILQLDDADGVETVAEDVANEAIPSTHTLLILPSPPSHDIPSTSQKLEIIKLKARIKRLERANKVKSSKLRRLKKVGTSPRIESSDDMEDVFNQGRMIDDLDKDKGIELVVDQVKDADIAETEGRHAAKQAEIYHLDLDHPFKVLKVVTAATSQVSAASATISAAKPSIPAVAPTVVTAYTRRRKVVIIRDPEEELSSKTLVETLKLKDKGKGILIETPKPMKKKDQIELDAEYARKLHEEINKDIDWDAAIDHVKQKSKENPQYIKRYQVMKKRPQTESESRKNMMIYLKNTAGYRLDFFKGMSYDEIRPIFQAFDANMRFLFNSREEMEEEDQEVLKSINETPAQKAAKRMKLNEEAC
uniref:Xylulose kinase-1 n=1 Tax=Tanacetum cinerariifolium TaxID=118510 RepID=A0A6L2MB44_TANCI|nr:hypothetical protein [Tanacetum cinerariifolium]